MKYSTKSEITVILTGSVILIINLIKFYNTLLLDVPLLTAIPNVQPKLVQLMVHTLGVVGAICLISIAIFLLSGARVSPLVSIIALVPALWCAIYSTLLYLNFRFVITASDQLFHTLFLTSASAFSFYYARLVSGIKPDYKKCMAFGLVASLFGVVTSVGHFIALSVLGSSITGPSLHDTILMLAISIYAFTVCYAIAKATPEKV